jgi:hypothetical protein
MEPRNTPSEDRGSCTSADVMPGRLTVFLVVTTDLEANDGWRGTTSWSSGTAVMISGVASDIATAPLPAGREPSSYLSFFFFKSVNTLSMLAFNTLISLDCSANVLACAVTKADNASNSDRGALCSNKYITMLGATNGCA